MLTLLLALTAQAHIHLLEPDNRTDAQKEGPCGADGSRPGAAVVTWTPGETVTVVFDETIDHPGWYRILLTPGGQRFPDPAAFDDTDAPEGDVILLWQAEDTEVRGHHEIPIVVPDLSCDPCVLQVVQVMTDKPPYGDGNDLYYQCADVAIVGPDDTDDGDTDGDTTDTSGDDAPPEGCACAQSPAVSPTLTALGLVLLARRRRAQLR